MRVQLLPALVGALLSAALAFAQATGTIIGGHLPDDMNGSNFTYPFPLKVFRFQSQLHEDLEMAFMDIPPCSGKDRHDTKTAVLLHGKNFCGATWEGTIRALTADGYRVVVPDQIGFCKSTKVADYQYSLHQFAWNTRGLLNTLGIGNVTVIGHSMGGMLAARFGLEYGHTVDKLVTVNSIGYEDYVAKGVPYISIDETVQTEAASTYESIRAYEQAMYYVGEWRDEYDVWVKMLVNIYGGLERQNFIRAQGRIVDMVLTQPVASHFEGLSMPTLLIIGEKDRTAIGSTWAPPDVDQKLGHFDQLGPEIVSRLPNGHLIRFPELGHAPQISNPDMFHEALTRWLSQ